MHSTPSKGYHASLLIAIIFLYVYNNKQAKKLENPGISAQFEPSVEDKEADFCLRHKLQPVVSPILEKHISIVTNVTKTWQTCALAGTQVRIENSRSAFAACIC